MDLNTGPYSNQTERSDNTCLAHNMVVKLVVAVLLDGRKKRVV
jgi:hypothetical protein